MFIINMFCLLVMAHFIENTSRALEIYTVSRGTLQASCETKRTRTPPNTQTRNKKKCGSHKVL